MNLYQFKPRKPLSILALDDDPVWRHFVKFTLELELKISPLLASNGQDALDILSVWPVDVVVTDLHMPGMDGFEFLTRARFQFPKTQVIIMSAAFDPSAPPPPALMAAGAAGIISKVEIASRLVDLVCRVCDRSPQLTS